MAPNARAETCSTKLFVTCQPELFTCLLLLLLQWRILGYVWGGREAVLELLHPPAVNPPCTRKENSSLLFAAHAPALRKFRMICREQQTRVRAPASASAVEDPVMLPGSRGYISPAGRAAALQRDLQDSKQLTSLLPWHASSRTGEGSRRRTTRCACV